MQDYFDIKICGLTTEDAVDAAIKAGATMLGFVFVERSPRFITPQAAAPLIARAKGKAETVGLFADMEEAGIRAIAEETGLARVQIHGREDMAARKALAAAFPGCLLARGISSKADLPSEDDAAPGAWLFDARPPKADGPQGGHGHAFDWAVLEAYRRDIPFLLAGGLNPENVGDAITQLAPHPQFAGVDVSSGVESAPGIKDIGKIEAFVSAARAARAQSLT